MRGRKATTKLQNIFSLLARCPQCGELLIRTNKGKWQYLVCNGAKNGQGCKYQAIPYGTLEIKFLLEFSNALSDLPVTKSIMSIMHKELIALRNRIKTCEKEQTRLINFLKADAQDDNIEAPRGIRDELGRIEISIENDKLQLKKIITEHNALQPSAMDGLIKEFIAVNTYDELNRERANSILRSMCESVIIEKGKVEIEFKVGPKLVIEYDERNSSFKYLKEAKPAIQKKPEAVSAVAG